LRHVSNINGIRKRRDEKKDGWLNMADFHSSTTTDNQLVKMLIHSKQTTIDTSQRPRIGCPILVGERRRSLCRQLKILPNLFSFLLFKQQ
jgi:hypothetical protein